MPVRAPSSTFFAPGAIPDPRIRAGIICVAGAGSCSRGLPDTREAGRLVRPRDYRTGPLLAVCLALILLLGPLTAARKGWAAAPEEPWRIRFLDAAIVSGPTVKLGEVAAPVGSIPPGMWEELARRELWPSPPEGGRAVNMTRPKLQEAVMSTMRDLAPYCLFPGAMGIQRGGKLVGKEAIQNVVSKGLQPLVAALPGEASLKDFRLPEYVFLDHAGQELSLEPMHKAAPGRISLRLLVREMDGTVRQRLTGSVFLDCWADVPCSSGILNREDLLQHTKVSFKRMNLANLRGQPWDGRGGPWRIIRPIGMDQVIYQNDLTYVPTVSKGTVVTLVYDGKNIHLTMQAEAMADGMAGESILVRNRQSRKEIYGVVRDSGTVMVNAAP
jgi:flagella basal body P-ring formation protein FlgA